MVEIQTAVAGSIELRTYAGLVLSEDECVTLSLPDLALEKKWTLEHLTDVIEESPVGLWIPNSRCRLFPCAIVGRRNVVAA